MNIIIVGCSQVGETLASQLVLEGNNITMIDLSSEKIKDITSRYDVMGVVGNGATHKTQLEAGVDTADLLIAVTDSDELNLLCCIIAKKTGKCRVIARVISPEYNTEIPYLKDEIGLEMVINPEFESAEEIARVLRFPSAMRIETFANGRVELVTFRLPDESPMVGMWLKDVITRLRVNVLICTVERGDDVFIPNGDFVFKAKDIISIVASHRAAYDFFNKINYNVHAVKDALIVGGGDLTHYLCSMLTEKGISVKVVDNDYERCEELSANFKRIEVIHSKENSQELLIEEGIGRCGAFVATTKHDEENILLSLFAKNSSKSKLVTKINRVDYDDIVKPLGLDTVIYPKSITADIIIRYVRATKNVLGSNVETMYNIIKGRVEASEFKVKNGSPITLEPLSSLHFKKGVLVAAILRDGAVIIPRGSDKILPGDSVIVVTKELMLRDISDTLSDKG